MKDWLLKRLTPRKADEPRWAGLSRVIQDVWESLFDPSLSRLERLKSFYQADEQDLDHLLREMGDYFQADFSRFEDKPISVGWRHLELEYKDLELILTSALRRHFKNLPVGWLPLFAPMDSPYGSRFIRYGGIHSDTEKNVAPEGSFLTSRGMLGVDYGHLLRMRMLQDTFLERAEPILRRTKPLHIVYNGPVFYIRHEIPVEAIINATWRDILQYEMLFSSLGGRFDFTPGDSRPLDFSSLEAAWDTRDMFSIPFCGDAGRWWRLDLFVGEGVCPWLPADLVIPGVEGGDTAPLSFLFFKGKMPIRFPFSAKVDPLGAESTSIPSVSPEFTCECAVDGFTSFDSGETLRYAAHGCLDLVPRYDEIPADFMPLDTPLGGTYA